MNNRYHSVNDILNISKAAPKPVDYSAAFTLPEILLASYNTGQNYHAVNNQKVLNNQAKRLEGNFDERLEKQNDDSFDMQSILKALAVQNQQEQRPARQRTFYNGTVSGANGQSAWQQTPVAQTRMAATPLNTAATVGNASDLNALSGLNMPFKSDNSSNWQLIGTPAPLNNGAPFSPYSNNYQGFSSMGGTGGGFSSLAPMGAGAAQDSPFGQIGGETTANDGFLSLSMGTSPLTPDQRQARLLYDTPQNSLFAGFA